MKHLLLLALLLTTTLTQAADFLRWDVSPNAPPGQRYHITIQSGTNALVEMVTRTNFISLTDRFKAGDYILTVQTYEDKRRPESARSPFVLTATITNSALRTQRLNLPLRVGTTNTVVTSALLRTGRTNTFANVRIE